MRIKIQKTAYMEGTINIAGAKNACLPEMVVSILTNQELILTNVPNIDDVLSMIKILEQAKVKISYDRSNKTLRLKRKKISTKIKSPYISKIRASYYLMGAIFSVKNKLTTYLPGGCNFVNRPINYHLDAFEKMGGVITTTQNEIKIKRRQKIPTIINLETKSVGTTINIILGSVLTRGETVINNASTEPEVMDVISLLNQMKANISVDQSVIKIKGVKRLFGTTHQIIPDRMEAGSYMFLAASMPKSNVIIKNIIPSHLTSVIELLKKQNVELKINNDSIIINKNHDYDGINLVADNYPSFPTDLQQIACSYLLNAKTLSIIKDNIYPKRFSEVIELLNMKGNLYIKDTLLLIMPSSLIGTTVRAADLRCGFALVLAGANALGETIIENAQVILRGYENVITKLNNCKILAEIC